MKLGNYFQKLWYKQISTVGKYAFDDLSSDTLNAHFLNTNIQFTKFNKTLVR